MTLYTCAVFPYIFTAVIRSFRSRRLERFAGSGDGSKLPVKNQDRVRYILSLLDGATRPEDMNLPGLRFHSLRGTPRRYAVDASANYRITWAWQDGDALDVDIEDYH